MRTPNRSAHRSIPARAPWLVALALTATAATATAQPADEPVTLSLPTPFTLELRADGVAFGDSLYRFGERFALVRDFRPARATASHDAPAFRALLPDRPVRVGETWRPDPAAAIAFLRQIHPGATEALHHGGGAARGIAAPGTVALLRAVGPGRAEIALRVHGEFRLDGDGGVGSSYLTPAQFRGHLVIDRARGVVTHFSLALPDAPSNVDVNVARGDGVIADIGRIARLEVRTATPRPTWDPTSAIDDATADERLAQAFYPLADVGWLSLPDALARSKATGKPIHVVTLFGPLLDESC